jgi:hypothetical protein
VHLDGALEPSIVSARDVGVASADMGDHDCALTFERAK